MIGIRKLLDFFFTRRELKILDDVMPETSKRNAADESDVEKDDDEESGDGSKKLPIGASGNLQIPLANGNIMKIPLTSINISEEVNKSGVWKQVNEDNGIATKDSKNSSPTKNKSVQTFQYLFTPTKHYFKARNIIYKYPYKIAQ
jgi:hypothetical protein